MAKAVKHSTMAREIKKEYLVQHLEDIKRLIASWISQLSVPNPLAPRGVVWNWQSVYSPNLERDSDSNHILRRHVQSRALWIHHTEWERKLSTLGDLVSQVRNLAEDKYLEQLSDEQEKYKENYIGIALWVAFDSTHSRKPLKLHYKIPDKEPGVALGDFKIELSASTANERTLIENEYKDFIHYLVGLEPMKELSTLWHEIQNVQEQMLALARKVLKSNDILYQCRFCRHLWK